MAVTWWMPLSFMFADVSSRTAGTGIIARATISRIPARLHVPGFGRPRRSGAWPARLPTGMQLVPHELVRALSPVAQDRPSVAWVDDLLDAEALGGPERRAHRLEPRGDLLAQGGAILRRLELAPVGGLEPTRHRQRAPVAGRPREAQVEP